MRECKTEAKTVQEAINKGLEELGLRRDQVEIRVDREPTSGFFLGLGAKKALVTLREKARGHQNGRFHKDKFKRGKRDGRDNRNNRKNNDFHKRDDSHRQGRYGYEDARLPQKTENTENVEAKNQKRRDRVYVDERLSEDFLKIQFIEDPVDHAKTVLLKLLSYMKIEEPVVEEAKLEESGSLIKIRFSCKDPDEFTSDNGRTLQSLQFTLNTIINKKREPHFALRLDTDNYWEKKEEEISSLVERAVQSVKNTGNSFRLDPMPAAMRKLVHNLVHSKYPGIKTSSEGEGRWRKVVISEDKSAVQDTDTEEQTTAEQQDVVAAQTNTVLSQEQVDAQTETTEDKQVKG